MTFENPWFIILRMGRKSIDNIRKPQILEHFCQVVNEEGIHKASVVKIAKKMGVSPNLVLHYFASKDAMIIALFDHIMDQYIEYLSDAISSVPEGPQRLKSLIKTMFGLGKNRDLLSEKSYYSFYYLSLFNDQIKQLFNKKYQQLTDMVLQEIESSAPYRGVHHIEHTEFVKQTELLLCLFEGFILKANIQMDGDHFKAFGNYFFERACTFFKFDINE